MVYAVIPYRIYQPTRAGNLLILAKPPVNRWDATLVPSHVPRPNHAGRKKQFIFYFFGASLLNAQRSPDFGQRKRIIGSALHMLRFDGNGGKRIFLSHEHVCSFVWNLKSLVYKLRTSSIQVLLFKLVSNL